MKFEQNIYPYNPELKGLPFLLTGIGGSRYQGKIVRPDGYPWHHILYCGEGSGVLLKGSERIELTENTFVFLPKCVSHTYYPTTAQWTVNWVTFDGAFCDETLAMLGLTDIIAVKAEDASAMNDIFGRMFLAQKTDILYSAYTCSGLIYDYILGFRRLFTSSAENKKSRQMSLLVPALKYMYDNYSEDIPIPYLAQLTGVTHQHFCRLFRSAMNMSPGDFLAGRRIDEAKRMLSDTDLPIAEISQQCGFNDPCYFSTTFKKHVGVPPTMYRSK